MTDKPLSNILHKPELSRRLVIWAVELGEYDIRYKSRTTIKGQVLADFVTEFGFTNDCIEEEENPEQIGLVIRTLS